MTRTILIVDDESNMRWVLGRALEQAGYTVHGAASGDEAANLLTREPIDLALLDLKLKGEDGLTILRRLRERQPELVVVMLTAYGTVPTAVEAMQLGAADFLRKPFDVEEVTFKIARALERRAMQQELARLTLQQRSVPAFETLIGMAVSWQVLLDQARAAAATDRDILIVGEAGSGRAALARAIHGASVRHVAPLGELDMGLFNPAAQHEAFFGANGNDGAWNAAGSGSLLVRGLSEAHAIHDALADCLATSALRAGPRLLVVEADASVLPAALTAHLPMHLRAPPLRERSGDALLLARHFVGERVITASAAQVLEYYRWPENVAELRSVILRAAQLAGTSPIDTIHLPAQVVAAPGRSDSRAIGLPPEGVNLEAVEQDLIRQALERARGNKSKAAELLGLTRHTLLYRMEKYAITAPERS
ncbi:MAG: response regulator [Roseiflexaceae bacterium]